MSLESSGCPVHLVMCLESDVLTVCNALKTILANEKSAHAVLRPPIFSSNRIEMAQELLRNAYKDKTTLETIHVLPGSHNMFFRLHRDHVDSNAHTTYHLGFQYRDKRPATTTCLMRAIPRKRARQQAAGDTLVCPDSTRRSDDVDAMDMELAPIHHHRKEGVTQRAKRGKT